MTETNIRITLAGASGLAKRDFLGLPDPFAVLTVDGEQTNTTGIIKRSLSPVWNETYQVSAKPTASISIQVFDHRKFRKRDQGFLGIVTLTGEEAISLASTESLGLITKDLTMNGNKLNVYGKLMLSFALPSSHTNPPVTDHLLLRPDQPAVIILGHFAPQIQAAFGFAGPDHSHNIVAQFYDVPHISTKPTLYPSYLASPSSISRYYQDAILASPSGHQIIADVLIAYMQQQICGAWDIAMGLAYDSDSDGLFDATQGKEGSQNANKGGLFGGLGHRKGVPEPEDAQKAKEGGDPLDPDARSKHLLPLGDPVVRVPPARINSPPPGTVDKPYVEIKPFCVSANDLVNPLPPSLFYGSGWFVHHPTSGDGHAQNAAAHYYYSTLPLSKLRIPLQVNAGDIGIYFVKEKAGKAGFGEGSAVECWVDDNYGGAHTLENAGDDEGVVLEMIDRSVSTGSHFVECQLLGAEGEAVPPFRIVGVFTT
ncbi:hypothetical protein ONZ45_g15219 [Pleurotus djamor]|nr:hypothetical protein ONZ45_g15219 [Pleurotus djamor]